MADLNFNSRLGAQYEFGLTDNDAPPELTGIIVLRSAELRYEAEVFAQAQDGEGMTDSIVTTLPQYRKITGTFGGYIFTGFLPTAVPPFFTFLERFFIVRNVGYPRRKGEFVEVSVEAESYGRIDG